MPDQAQLSRTDQLYQLVTIADTRIGEANLTGSEQERLRWEVNHGAGLDGTGGGGLGGISDAERQNLMTKLGLDPNQFNKMVTVLRLKHMYESASPEQQKDFWAQKDALGFNTTGENTRANWIDGANQALGDIASRTESQASAAAKAKAEGDQINEQLAGWVKSNQGPVGPNDQIAQNLSQFGADAAQRRASAAGIQGGLSGVSAQAGAQNALAPYLQQRQQNVLTGLNAMSSRDLGLRQAALQQMAASNAASAQNFAAQQNQAAGIGGLIGGTVGSLGFIASPAVGAATMAGGAALGSGIGGMTAGSGPRMQTTPNYTGYRGGFGGSSGGGPF